ncbi:MAG: ABC-F family ATP-binding cassette domain-containing protein [Saprospiraceae bacterium]|nr:ABC-F family ATP-binding cassette domain-containing protein [Saprospiraceae bacterium]
MIHLKNLFIRYGDRKLFNDITVLIKGKDKIALVGRNGAGKTTLFKIISQEINPDAGKVEVQNDVKIGYLDQYLESNDRKTVWEVAKEAFADTLEAERELDRLQKEIEEATEFESDAYMRLLEDYNQQLERVDGLDADRIDKRIELVLKGMGFTRKQFEHRLDTFSGGWKMRAQFAQLLLQEPDLLLLDEPTNHLDIEAIIWLEEYIRDYPGAVILISHDKAFLQNTASRVLEIEMGNLYDYPVPYAKYEVQKVERRAIQESAYKNQQKVIADRERTIKRFMAKATKTSMAQSMQKQLDKMERVELDVTADETMKIRFLPIPRSGRTVIKASGVGKSYGDNHVLHGVDLQIDRGDRISIVGQNGQGKTTLARILINELAADAGTIEHGTQLAIGYYAQNQSEDLDQDETILESMDRRAPDGMHTRVRSVLGAFMFSGEDAEKKIKVLSGGERARLAFARMLMEPLNVLVLDEPTNHLDMASKEVLKRALLDYTGTLIVVSHDRDFLADLTNTTIELKDLKMKKYLGDINYFLEKKNLENMRDVELQKSANVKPVENLERPQAQGKELSFEERKLLQKEVKKAEREVERLEKKAKELEQQMASVGFFEQNNAEAVGIEYQQVKKHLELAEENWMEKLQEAEGL